MDDEIKFTSPTVSSVSISAWIKPDQLQIQGITALYDGAKYIRLFMSNASGGVEFDTNPGEIGNATASGISTNTWQHVEAVYDAQAQTAVVYVDGVPGTVKTGVTGFGTGGNTGAIGSLSGAWYNDGTIDDVRIYDYARSAEQVLVDYNQGLSVRLGAGKEYTATTPIAHWDFN